MTSTKGYTVYCTGNTYYVHVFPTPNPATPHFQRYVPMITPPNLMAPVPRWTRSPASVPTYYRFPWEPPCIESHGVDLESRRCKSIGSCSAFPSLACLTEPIQARHSRARPQCCDIPAYGRFSCTMSYQNMQCTFANSRIDRPTHPGCSLSDITRKLPQP